MTRLELFFDLVFVFGLTQLTAMLSHDRSAETLLRVGLVFAVLWWMHGGYAWLTNALPPHRTAHRLLVFLGMGGFLTMALVTPEAFDEVGAGVILGLGYLTVVLVHAGLLLTQPAARAGIMRVAPLNVLAALLLIGAGLVSGPAQYAPWLAVLGLHTVTPFLTGMHRWHVVRPTHFVERYGLLVIVVFGESVVAVGIGASSLPVDGGLVLVALLGLALAVAMWWTYFGGDEDERAEQVLASAPASRRARIAVATYFYAHIPIVLGVILASAGVETAVGHPFARLPLSAALVLSGGVALFLAGEVLFRRGIGYEGVSMRLAAAALAAATALLGLVAAVWQLTALVAVVAAVLAGERRRRAAAVGR